MVEAGRSSSRQPTPLPVWSELAMDYRVQAVRLMVQLVLKFVAPQVEGRPQEVAKVNPNPDKPEPNRVKNCYIKQKEYTTVAGFSVFIAKSILDAPKEPF